MIIENDKPAEEAASDASPAPVRDPEHQRMIDEFMGSWIVQRHLQGHKDHGTPETYQKCWDMNLARAETQISEYEAKQRKAALKEVLGDAGIAISPANVPEL